jgi:hypothetical protein
VQFQGVVIGESSIWGIESDSDESYFAETETEQIKEALAEAKAFRKELAS